MTYKIRFSKEAETNLKSIPKRDRVRISKRIASLKQDPRPDSAKKLRGRHSLYRVRQGNWRIIYHIGNAKLCVLIIKIGDRKDVYLKL